MLRRRNGIARNKSPVPLLVLRCGPSQHCYSESIEKTFCHVSQCKHYIKTVHNCTYTTIVSKLKLEQNKNYCIDITKVNLPAELQLEYEEIVSFAEV